MHNLSFFFFFFFFGTCATAVITCKASSTLRGAYLRYARLNIITSLVIYTVLGFSHYFFALLKKKKDKEKRPN